MNRELARMYTEAAESLHEGAAVWSNGACYAVFDAADSHEHYEHGVAAMESLFMEEAVEAGPHQCYWGANFGAVRYWKNATTSVTKVNERVAKDCRILMLCFLAAMAEAGDL